MERKTHHIVVYIRGFVMALLCVVALAPIVIIAIYSLTKSSEIVEYFSKLGARGEVPFVGLKIVPEMLSIDQYYEILIEEQKFLTYFANSSWYAIATVLGQVLIAPMAAFAFSKFKFKGRDTIFFIYIVIMMMPFQVVMIPNYIMIEKLRLFNTGWSIILPSVFMPFAVFLMRQYMLGVPDEMIEAARIDGASMWWVYMRIMLPMVIPGLSAMIVLGFAEAWNLVEQPLLFLPDATKHPLSLVLKNTNIIPVKHMFAGAVMFMAPVIILFLIFQDYIVKGIEKFEFKD